MPALLLAGLFALIQACSQGGDAAKPTSDPELAASSCLEGLDLERLDEALNHCNAVVKGHPGNPIPLTDRSLIHTLMGRDDEACDDVKQASALMAKDGQRHDPLLKHELAVRQQSCKQRATMAGNG